MSTLRWTFLANHAHVLVCIDRDPTATMRGIAEQVGITERATLSILRDLEDGGYLTRVPAGRRTSYVINHRRPFRRFDPGSVTQLRDVAIADHQRLVLFRRGARAVDHAHVGQRDDGLGMLDVVTQRVLRLRVRSYSRCHQPKDKHKLFHTPEEYADYSRIAADSRGLSCRGRASRARQG